MANPVETYLGELARIRSTGAAVRETSYYPTLSNLLNEIGKQLAQKVSCVMPISNQGAGFPDGGLFTQDQLQRNSASGTMEGLLPSRGVIEVKGAGDDAWLTAESEQVSKYWKRYNQVLVTNYRDFVLIGRDDRGRPIKLESFRLAHSEDEFWAMASTPRRTATEIGERLTDYLKRAMLQPVPIRDPEDVAWFLASYAREARARLELKDIPALDAVRRSLESSLGVKFEGPKGDHFFRSTLVQTLFYGVFSAWILWMKEHSSRTLDRFEWKNSAWLLHVPMVRELFEQIATPTKLGDLGIVETLMWTGELLNRVELKGFFQRFEDQHAVQYFYEPFLEAFDPELRKEMGVWYTPQEVVKYMVARVNRTLKDELGIENGLANPKVYVLDPAAGTGSFLVEVLRVIAEELGRKSTDALAANDLKKAATERILGFEILPAPFVVAHLQIGLLLQSLGVRFYEKEHVGVYLTNSLTGWQKSEVPSDSVLSPEFEKEREQADDVKQNKPILVVLGNPPYNGFAGVSPQEERGLVEPYKEGLVSEWKIKKFNLDDLYVRFFRLAETRIAEKTGRGIVCYISNFSFLNDPSFVVMRKRFLEEFDEMRFDCLNGSSRETGKRTPEGGPDPSIFSTDKNPEGIRVGTVVSLLVKKSASPEKPKVLYRDFWGQSKREDLVASLTIKDFDKSYTIIRPSAETRYSFRSKSAPTEYMRWPEVVQLSRIPPFNGPVERRGNSLIKFEADRASLGALQKYLDPSYSNEQIRVVAPRFMKSSGEFKADDARKIILKRGVRYDMGKIRKYYFKPLDLRLAYLDPNLQPLFSRPSPELVNQLEIPENYFLITRDTADKSPEGVPFYLSRMICDYDSVSGHARHFPTMVRETMGEAFEWSTSETKHKEGGPFPNLSNKSRDYLATLGLRQIGEKETDLVWMHVLAVGYSPRYLSENSNGIRTGWPRVPLPDSIGLLKSSAELGRRITNLIDMDSELPTAGNPKLFSQIGVITRQGGGALDPSDLKLTAGWGHGVDVVMPGTGKCVRRDYTERETSAVRREAKQLGLTLDEMLKILGARTCDVYLNDLAYWRSVPTSAWDFIIGGYQVLKKWLSYHEFEVVGRQITIEEARYFTAMTRRITSLILLGPQLDANYLRIKESSFDWQPS